jgi:hypothetical protein
LLEVRLTSSPPHHQAQLPYNAFSWTLRTAVNGIVISGNALAMLALFSLTLTSWGDRVAEQARRNQP